MNRNGTHASISKSARASGSKASRYGKLPLENSFLSCSDETIEDLFSMLAKLPSPLKEETFVQFCLVGTCKMDSFH